jgi:hypothetical protein
MKIKSLALLCLVALSFTAPQSKAALSLNSGNDLKELCQATSKTGPVNELICLTYLMGFLSGFTFGQAEIMGTNYVNRKDVRRICLPERATVGQVREVVLKFSREHPEILHESPEELLIGTFVKYFKCKT